MKAKKDEEDEEEEEENCCSLPFLTCLFGIFNCIFAVSGLAMGSVALWTILTHHQFMVWSLTYSIILWLMVATASLILLQGLLGLVGLKCQIKWLLIMYAGLLVLVWMAELVIGMLGYVYYEEVEDDLSRKLLPKVLNSYGLDSFTKDFDVIQSKYKCCGISSPDDWNSSWWQQDFWSRRPVPDSCCKTISFNCGASTHPSNIDYTGCVHPLSDEMKGRLLVLAALGLGFSILQVFGLIYTLCLVGKLKTHESYRALNKAKKAEQQHNEEVVEVNDGQQQQYYGWKFETDTYQNGGVLYTDC